MATRRKKSGFPTMEQWFSHPFKSYKRAARKIDTGRAAWLKEKNDIKAARAKAKLARDKEIAKKRQVRERKKAAKDAQRRARADAAEARARQNAAQPTVVRAPSTTPRAAPSAWTVSTARARAIRPGATRQPAAGPSTAATARARAIRPVAAQQPASVLCGSRETDNGDPCTHPTTGGKCAAGHRPANKPRAPRPAAARTDRVASNQRRFGVTSNEDFDAPVPRRFLDERFGRTPPASGGSKPSMIPDEWRLRP